MPNDDEKSTKKRGQSSVVNCLIYLPPETMAELNSRWKERGYDTRASCVRKVLTAWLERTRPKQNAS